MLEATVEVDAAVDDDEELDNEDDADMGSAFAVGEEGARVPVEAEDWELNKLSRSNDGIVLTDSVNEGAQSLNVRGEAAARRWLEGGNVYLGQFEEVDSWVVHDKCSEWWSLTTAACR